MDATDKEYQAGLALDTMRRLSRQHAALVKKYLGDPPNIRNVPLAIWQQIQRDRAAALFLLILASSNGGYSTLGGSQNRYFIDHVTRWAAGHANAQANRYVRSTQNMFSRSADAGNAVDDSLDRVFGEQRDVSVVSNTWHDAEISGGELAVQYRGVASEYDIWVIRPELSKSGVCPICEPLANQPRSVWMKVAPSGPPLHPSCNCEIEYDQLDGMSISGDGSTPGVLVVESLAIKRFGSLILDTCCV